MKNIHKIIYMIVMCVVLSISITASNSSTTMDVHYGIKIAVDGQTATLTDANGNAVYPFTNNGTTYVPIRAVSELLGAGVYYEAETKTAHLFSKEVLDNYNKYGTATPPETNVQLSQSTYDIFKLMMDVESCVDEYNYVDHNINGVLYKYFLDTGDAVNFIDELRDHINDVQKDTVHDISFWIGVNFTSYDSETERMLLNLRTDLENAFKDIESALDSLEDFIDHPDFTLDSQVDRYYNNFESYLSSAREAITACSITCDTYIDVYVESLDEYTN